VERLIRLLLCTNSLKKILKRITEMSNDAIERLRQNAEFARKTGNAAQIRADDARAILATFDAMIAALADAQEQIDELRENEIWRKIHND
jgi:hypothetical protein